jgi:hypothetical protein
MLDHQFDAKSEREKLEHDLPIMFDDLDAWDDDAEPVVMTRQELVDTINAVFLRLSDAADDAAWNEAARPLIEAAKTAGFYRDMAGFFRHSFKPETILQ